MAGGGAAVEREVGWLLFGLMMIFVPGVGSKGSGGLGRELDPF